ncbi:hypothetical protein BKA70DRAFT_1308219 [Coprinopsis sp. MPI-PUGE-AT-0042]|nr:hypothetical protein BKA70DRAFT_1308219 [Coprinopsis sp. MPI-PUGE-AT-0042]
MSNTDPFIHQLPAEVLVQIFRHLRAIEDRSEWNASKNDAALRRAVVPYSISSVCRYWDETSSLAPELWNHASILVSLENHEGGSPARMVERYLRRAHQDDPFVVRIECGDISDGNEEMISERQSVAALLPVLSAHLHRISELFLLTNFATSLPPYAFLCPQSGQSATLQKLTVKSNQSRSPETVPLPAWPRSPATIPYIPQMAILNLSGQMFISFCRSRFQPLPHEPRRCTTLTARNLFRGCSGALRLDEFLQFLEQVGPTLRGLALMDVDLPGGSNAQTAAQRPSLNQSTAESTTNTIFSLSHVNEDTVLGLLSFCHQQVFRPDVMMLNGCTFSRSPLDILIPGIGLILHSSNVRSIINVLFAIDPSRLVIMPTCGIGDGVELLQQLEAVRRDDGSSLLLDTRVIEIQRHKYIPLDALCTFAETKFAASSSTSPLSRLEQIRIEPTCEDWERMQAEASERWATQRKDDTGEGIMAWDVSGEHFHASVLHKTWSSVVRVIVEFNLVKG